MAILKIPKASSDQREGFLLEESELVYDKDTKAVYCGDGSEMGGFKIGGADSDFITCRIKIDEAALSTKQVTLPFMPYSPSTIEVIPEGGPQQVNDLDFRVSGNIISWDGMGLDGFLELEEHLIINGFKK